MAKEQEPNSSAKRHANENAQEHKSVEEIAKHRKKIDEIDKQIVHLLNERAVESLTIRQLKPAAHMGLYDAAREEQISELLSQHNDGPLYDDNLRTIYATILRVMKEAPSL